MNNIQKAKKIACKDLRACYKKWGVFASLVNFSDYWARDSFWAVFGMLEVGDFEQAKKTLELFMKYQHKSGKISRKISNDFNQVKYLFKIKILRTRLKPVYRSSLRSGFSMDGNLLFVIAFCRYVERTGDIKFAKDNFLKARSALEFYPTKRLIRGCLLNEHGLSSWMDTVFKKGFVLYTNCLWFEAIKQLDLVTKSLGYARSVHIPPARLVRKSIVDVFWLPGKNFFADSVSKENVTQEYFDLAGNTLAALFGIAGRRQVVWIFSKVESIISKKSGLHPVNDPPYPWWKINPFASLVGIYSYHNGISWPWVECILIVALIEYGNIKLATKTLRDLSLVIVENGHFYETYKLDGKPFGNFFWKSTVPFAWSSSLFLYAMSELEKSRRK
ncbi:MAG: amylo-alpha-1,6-glucosidase [Patescibacteria group bacterium]|nr:amylo-alpha-1,6-glucosidase [Patescibacteria group bacterium]